MLDARARWNGHVQQLLHGGEPVALTLKLGLAWENIGSEWAKCGNEPGDSELPKWPTGLGFEPLTLNLLVDGVQIHRPIRPCYLIPLTPLRLTIWSRWRCSFSYLLQVNSRDACYPLSSQFGKEGESTLSMVGYYSLNEWLWRNSGSVENVLVFRLASILINYHESPSVLLLCGGWPSSR